MKEELIKELVSIIKDSKHFLLDQAPEVIKQIIQYEIISRIYYIGIGLFMTFIWYKIVIKYQGSKDELTSFILKIFGFLSGFLIAVILFSNIDGLIKVLVSPKMFLLEYLTSSCK